MKKIVLRHRSYVKIKQPPVSSSSRRVECENFFPAHCDLFIIHAANDLGLSLYCIQNLGYTRQRPNMVGMRSLASCSTSFCNCLRCQVQLQRLSLLLLLPTHCHRDGAEAVRLVIQKPNCGFAAWLSALLSTPLGRCCCCPCRASVCEWKWTNHWWASASGRELVYLSECVQVIQSSFCRWRDQLVAAALSLPRVRAPWLFLCVSLCVCVCRMQQLCKRK